MTTQMAVQSLAFNLMRQHGLHSWTFAFDNARQRVGQCVFETRTITVSRHYVALNTLHRIHLTLLHEIAHALVGPGHGHDQVWKRQCLAIGGTGTTSTSQAVADTVTPPTRWIGTCACGQEYRRHRLTTAARTRSYCPNCSGHGQRYPESARITWKENAR